MIDQPPHNKHIIIFNAPPHSGKDSSIEAITFPHKKLKFAGILKEDTHRHYDLGVEEDYFEGNKDTPLDAFNGLTAREAYIKRSIEVKASRGSSYYADQLVQSIVKSSESVHIITDMGFQIEMDAICQLPFPILVIKIDREGCNYENDSRVEVNSDAVSTVRIENNGSLQDFQIQVTDLITTFIEDSKK